MKRLLLITFGMLITLSSFASHKGSISGRWYSPSLDRLVQIERFGDELVVDFNIRRHGKGEIHFHRISKRKFRSYNGSKIKVLNKNKIKYFDNRRKRSLILIKRNRYQDRGYHCDWNDDYHFQSYEDERSLWVSNQINTPLEIRHNGLDIQVRLKSDKRWTNYYKTDRRNTFENNKGETIQFRKNDLIWRSRNEKRKLIFTKSLFD